MKPARIYILSSALLVQWGIVSVIGGVSKNGLHSALYFVSFMLFWAGLVLAISQTFKLIAQRKKKRP